MSLLKDIKMKHDFFKFKVSYFLYFFLFLSLVSCTEEDVAGVIEGFLLIMAIGYIILIVSFLYFVLMLLQLLWLWIQRKKINESIKVKSGYSKSMTKIIGIAQNKQDEKRRKFARRYFLIGSVPLVLLLMILLFISIDLGELTLLFIINILGAVSIPFFFHIGSSYIISLLGITPVELSETPIRLALKPKELFVQLKASNFFSSYTIEAFKNELVLKPKKSIENRVFVIQCNSRTQEGYV